MQIDYSFAVALKLVTVAEFKKFRPGVQYSRPSSPGEDTPIDMVSWYDAAAYCNWLSGQEKIPKDQWCYEPNDKGEYHDGMKMKTDYQNLAGYRLPRGTEWEYVCQAGTVTAWSHGSDETMLGHYAWYPLHSKSTFHPVGALKPNGLGLFDMHGDAWQWCQEGAREEKNKDKEVIPVRERQGMRTLRGGHYIIIFMESSFNSRVFKMPSQRDDHGGFRVVRTYG